MRRTSSPTGLFLLKHTALLECWRTAYVRGRALPPYQKSFPRIPSGLRGRTVAGPGIQGTRDIPGLLRAPPFSSDLWGPVAAWLGFPARAARKHRAPGENVAVHLGAPSPANLRVLRAAAALARAPALDPGTGMASVTISVASVTAQETSPTAPARAHVLESGPLRRGAMPSLLPPRPPIMAATRAPMGATSRGPASWTRRERKACDRRD